MGVPAFFRWLTKKYPSVVVECIEEQEFDSNGQPLPVDSSKRNPNGVEFDNFYLDMNGIIHPCTHPENKPPPKNEDEMMIAIFECIDRLFKIVRPRKVLYMAIDGVAPRAKMNQQRSRRFRAAKETMEKAEQIAKIRAQLEAKGIPLPSKKEGGEHFDSNCITPGTEFMSRLTECLNYYILHRLNNDPGWKGLKVILSDASVPGEGEHKIMDFIRRQKALPYHDMNTHHCLCGADADLIMLGLATHEPNFTIIREEFIMNQPKRCEICNQTGHEMKECKGLPNNKEDFENMTTGLPPSQTKYIFVRLNVLRDHLKEELRMSNVPFEYDFERAIDDWVFMCFFVGNDFLPHLPSLEIREGAIDRLVNLYKRTVYRTGGFITDSGDMDMGRVQLILNDLGAAEDEIFRRRQRNEVSFRSRNIHRKVQERLHTPEHQYKSEEEIIAEIEKEDPVPVDEVRLGDHGYKERYYNLKFNLTPDDHSTRYKVGMEYARGLCWVLKYYYQGCISWKWYFPYHYAPFASDIININDDLAMFEKNTKPFSPLEQLMGVFPAASRNLVPSPWANLMVDPESHILDFYPTDFMIDLNGKKFAWQGVALLPFVDEARLRKGLEPVYSHLTQEEVERNTKGDNRLYVCTDSDCYDFISNMRQVNEDNKLDIFTKGVCGKIYIKNVAEFVQGAKLNSPLPGQPMVRENKAHCVRYCDPSYPEGFKFVSHRLSGERDVSSSSTSNQNDDSTRRRPQIGMAPRRDEAHLGDAGHRMLRHNLPREFAVPIGGSRRFGNDRMGDHGSVPTHRRGGFWAVEDRRERNVGGNMDDHNQLPSVGGVISGDHNKPPFLNRDDRSEQLRQYQQAARIERTSSRPMHHQYGSRGGGGGGGGQRSDFQYNYRGTLGSILQGGPSSRFSRPRGEESYSNWPSGGQPMMRGRGHYRRRSYLM